MRKGLYTARSRIIKSGYKIGVTAATLYTGVIAPDKNGGDPVALDIQAIDLWML